MINFQKLRPIVFALIFTGISASGLAWVWLSITSYGDDLYERVEMIANDRAFEKQYKELLTMLEETESDRQILEQFILNDDTDTIAMLSKIDEIALRQGVDLTTQELKVIEGANKFDNLSVSFSLSGSERSVTQIIRMFETLPYHGHITSLSARRSQDDATGGSLIQAEITLLVSIKKHDQ